MASGRSRARRAVYGCLASGSGGAFCAFNACSWATRAATCGGCKSGSAPSTRSRSGRYAATCGRLGSARSYRGVFIFWTNSRPTSVAAA